MSTRRVRAHTRDGHRVSGYRQGGRSPRQKAIDGGLGALASAGALTSVVFDTVGLVIEIGALLLATVFGLLLGVRSYKTTPAWKRNRLKARIQRAVKPRRRHASRTPKPGPPARRNTGPDGASPFAGTAPWAGRPVEWRYDNGKLRQVSNK
jgi:hypothetical protein